MYDGHDLLNSMEQDVKQIEEKLDHQFNKLSMLVKERTETVPDIVRVEHQTHTEFFINNISIRRYNELMERLLTRRLHLYKTKENEIRNKWNRPFAGRVPKYRPAAINYAEEIGADHQLVLDFQRDTKTLYQEHMRQFGQEVADMLYAMRDCRERKEKAPRVKTVQKAFDDELVGLYAQAKERVDYWADILGAGDPHVLAYGEVVYSPRSFGVVFRPQIIKPCAVNHAEKLKKNNEKLAEDAAMITRCQINRGQK